MANIISNNNTNTNGNGNSLRDLLQSQTRVNVPVSTSNPYDIIIELIRGLDLQDDGILMNHKIKSIETEFCNIVRTENMLCESMEYINDKALEDGDIALKFALLFSSRNFDSLAMMETKVRSAMLKILETNFHNAEVFRIHDKERLYNSITLLGEYYHRLRLADNSPFKILGSSLLELLTREIRERDTVINVKLAKLILSQITLNGDIMRERHQAELTELLYHIRRNLIEQPALKPAEKALLIMTLDLYYSNFANLGAQLEEMYTQYLVQEHEENHGNNNVYTPTQQHPQNIQQLPQSSFQTELQANHLQQSPDQQTENFSSPSYQNEERNLYSDSRNKSYENGVPEEPNHNASFENKEKSTSPPPTTKKWSEQVCEDSMLESELFEGDISQTTNLDNSTPSNTNQQKKHNNKNSRRSYQPRRSPRPLNKHTDENEIGNQQSYNNETSLNEERDESKPLPRWRAPRFNRDPNDERQYNDGRRRQSNQQRRFSASYEDDRHSVRSEGGSIRLYSINDRLKHAQEKMERSNRNHYNNIANSNWDHQSQRDDRSERSYISNYERGNHNHRRGHGQGHGRPYNNRQGFDKPPRFQKFQNQQNSQQLPNKDHKIHSESWRRSNTNYDHNNQELNNDGNIRAKTLPRPAKSNMDGHNSSTSTYRRSQSPNQSNYNRVNHNSRSRNYNSRWSSQSSLASEASSIVDRNNINHKHRHKNRNFNRPARDENTVDDFAREQKPDDWQPNDTNSEELVRNARKTANYMNYLSSK